MLMPPAIRKLALTVHVTASVASLGAVGGFLALAIVGITGEDGTARAAYGAMPVLAWSVILPLVAAALVTGIIQSLGTIWGLLQHYWVVIKLLLTVFATVVLLLQMPVIDSLAAAAGVSAPAGHGDARVSVLVHAAGGLLVLLVATVLSIYKPQGLTRYGANRRARRRDII